MKENLIISGYCRISDHRVVLNGENIFESSKDLSFPEFIKEVYRFKELSYPKFFKMDNLSKLGFATVEVLLGKEDEAEISGDNTAIVFANAVSSLDTDLNYQETIQDSLNYFPSPAVFVYTLPNIVIGEICIKHKITGESAFYVMKEFDADLFHFYVSDLMERQKTDRVLFGWIDFLENEYISLFCLVKKSQREDKMNFTAEHIKKIFKNIEPNSYGRIN